MAFSLILKPKPTVAHCHKAHRIRAKTLMKHYLPSRECIEKRLMWCPDRGEGAGGGAARGRRSAAPPRP
ncbi:hypothetical protein EVAR_16121_1 [Eumeta japonica]|uniref:Uncharacterized protein n=1 Tax=Eumeta variegata TaxID=151549 RepID=A0A4C1UJJ6_EUMVA|nr:hypothetical protein EVAR_16121_1 [Eumeta japonica]